MTDAVVDPAAPEIPGHRFLRKIGRGGFADVYAYEQLRPNRTVAVKVSRADAADHEARARFQNEANMMVRAAQHNAIVHIFNEADTADGRQYMTMEYCGSGNLGIRYRSERNLALRTVLPWAIKLAGAVETIHRAGILHRDIKPTNVLFTDLGQPKLSDFGISAPIGSPAEGMSVRWSPPESFANPPSGDERSDIYSLAATIYAAVSGHAPFETPGQKPRDAEIISRTQRDPLPRINRPDVPDSLYQVLARAMAKRPAERYSSAAVFASELKRIEDELGFPATDPEIRDSTGYQTDFVPDEQDDQATRVRGAVSINMDGPAPVSPAPVSPAPAQSFYGTEDDEATRVRGARVFATDVPRTPDGTGSAGPVTTVPAAGAPLVGYPQAAAQYPQSAAQFPQTQPLPAPAPAAKKKKRLVPIIAALGVVAVLVVAVVLTMNGKGPGPAPEDDFTSGGAPEVPIAKVVPKPVDLVGEVTPQGVVFTWSNTDPQEGDFYRWSVVQVGEESSLITVEEESVTVDVLPQSTEVCVQVSLVRADRSSSEFATACAQVSR